VRYETPFGSVGNLTTKLDIGPAPWLPPEDRGWVPVAIHAAYELPASIPEMALEENMAERLPGLPAAPQPGTSTTSPGSPPPARIPGSTERSCDG